MVWECIPFVEWEFVRDLQSVENNSITVNRYMKYKHDHSQVQRELLKQWSHDKNGFIMSTIISHNMNSLVTQRELIICNFLIFISNYVDLTCFKSVLLIFVWVLLAFCFLHLLTKYKVFVWSFLVLIIWSSSTSFIVALGQTYITWNYVNLSGYPFGSWCFLSQSFSLHLEGIQIWCRRSQGTR